MGLCAYVVKVGSSSSPSCADDTLLGFSRSLHNALRHLVNVAQQSNCCRRVHMWLSKRSSSPGSRPPNIRRYGFPFVGILITVLPGSAGDTCVLEPPARTLGTAGRWVLCNYSIRLPRLLLLRLMYVQGCGLRLPYLALFSTRAEHLSS